MVDSTSVELGLGTLETGLHLEEDRQDLLKTERLDDGSAATHTQTREMATGIPEGWTKDNENGKRTMSGGDGNEEESGEGSVPTSMDILSIPGILTKLQKRENEALMKTRQLIEEVENNFTKSLYDQKAFFLSGRSELEDMIGSLDADVKHVTHTQKSNVKELRQEISKRPRADQIKVILREEAVPIIREEQRDLMDLLQEWMATQLEQKTARLDDHDTHLQSLDHFKEKSDSIFSTLDKRIERVASETVMKKVTIDMRTELQNAIKEFRSEMAAQRAAEAQHQSKVEKLLEERIHRLDKEIAEERVNSKRRLKELQQMFTTKLVQITGDQISLQKQVEHFSVQIDGNKNQSEKLRQQLEALDRKSKEHDNLIEEMRESLKDQEEQGMQMKGRLEEFTAQMCFHLDVDVDVFDFMAVDEAGKEEGKKRLYDRVELLRKAILSVSDDTGGEGSPRKEGPRIHQVIEAAMEQKLSAAAYGYGGAFVNAPPVIEEEEEDKLSDIVEGSEKSQQSLTEEEIQAKEEELRRLAEKMKEDAAEEARKAQEAWHKAQEEAQQKAQEALEKQRKEMEEMMKRLSTASSEEQKSKLIAEQKAMEERMKKEKEEMERRMKEDETRRALEAKRFAEEAERRKRETDEAERKWKLFQEEKLKRESRESKRKEEEERAKEIERQKQEEKERRKQREEERKKKAQENGPLGLPQGTPHKVLPPRPPSPSAAKPSPLPPPPPPSPPLIIDPEWTDSGYRPPQLVTGNLIDDMKIGALGTNLDKVDKRTRTNWIGKKLKDVVYLVQQKLEEKVNIADFITAKEGTAKALWEVQRQLSHVDSSLEKKAEQTFVEESLKVLDKKKIEDSHLDPLRLIIEELSMTTGRLKSAQGALREIVDGKPDSEEVSHAIHGFQTMSEGMQHLHRLSEEVLTELAGVELAVCQLTGRQDEVVEMVGEAFEAKGALDMKEGGIVAAKTGSDSSKNIQLYRKREKTTVKDLPLSGKRFKAKEISFEPIVVSTPPQTSPGQPAANSRIQALRQSLVRARLGSTDEVPEEPRQGGVKLPKLS